jgi:hypothetical protein
MNFEFHNPTHLVFGPGALSRLGEVVSMRLSKLNIDDTLITRYAQDTLRIIHDENGNLPGRPAMTEADIIEVLQSAL